MIETCTIQAVNEEQMRKTGVSLVRSLYRRSGSTIVLRGELGAGKTTFVQGFAEGMGIPERVTSPTYALEQRYGDSALSHIDLYRLNPVQAAEFFRTLDPFPGIRVIEWSDRTSGIEADIEIDIKENTQGRSVSLAMNDVSIPTDEVITGWMNDAGLPEHIRRHVRKVAEVSHMVAVELLKQGRVVREKALRAAALSHDLLRFVDFKSMTGDAVYSPTPEEIGKWKFHKETFGTPHELAAEKFLIAKGFPEIATIVRTHRGHGQNSVPQTIEQNALCYADKRAIVDTYVTLDQRFDDFMVRYGNGKESAEAGEWRSEMKRIEAFLFPGGTPF